MPASSVPLIAFLSDYGRADPFVGLCHAVVASLAPHARVIDLTHDIAPQGVAEGAVVLADCLPYLPASVLLAVVDPGVGTARRAVVVSAGIPPQRRLLVGPDNGLLWPAAEALGGADGAWIIDADALGGRPEGSRTFDGRDVFAPVAALLAAGAHPDDLGEAMPVTELIRPELPTTSLADGVLHTSVLRTDRFGNLLLAATAEELAQAAWVEGDEVCVEVGERSAVAQVCTTFADVGVGSVGLLPDAFARLQVAVRDGDAARLLAGTAGSSLRITDAVVVGEGDVDVQGTTQ
jgi:S-adenosyl-L-methionine hydrolase (adenosine-forming)